MPSKWAKLKSKIPGAPVEMTPREQAIQTEMDSYVDRSFDSLTAAYNTIRKEKDELDGKLEKVEIRLDAVERVLREQFAAENVDGVKAHGFTWSPKTEPYPVVDDAGAMVQHFIDEKHVDFLTVNHMRLKSLIKEEADANELQIVTKEIIDEQTGETHEETIVRSNIPGVRVFMKDALSRVKSTK